MKIEKLLNQTAVENERVPSFSHMWRLTKRSELHRSLLVAVVRVDCKALRGASRAVPTPGYCGHMRVTLDFGQAVL